MEKIDDGGFAFPYIDQMYPQPGMTRRDYFAGQVLVERLSYGFNDNADTSMLEAKTCYQIADAMLKARQERKG